MDFLVDLGDVCVARATREHISAIERLLADDPTSPQHVATTNLVSDDMLGEGPQGADLEEAFARIDADPNQDLFVVLDDGDRAIGTMQLSLLPTMARGGGIRGVVTGARIRAGADSIIIARRVVGWLAEHARERGARVLIIITDKNRAHIHGFYTTMGFRQSHEGLVLPL
ncbi:GNAT family N-acetyltransferase [Propioniciclava sinopodophylli]|jgi:GNAT superfamily N-acetyltransferase|uniref:GNAT family N-acetyltransferase n=1 Tax=Propioniciclava sinopodophylli TaxID=1837344 RepID=A0A4Q9KEJ7_9ACTN|nr:GNAT family N-acetyltransferase [Propioniciclava sinopodophylli]TBT85864.1 GNAT family N-acetyltransferase [Propioniciclava sinopodophylli]